MEHYDIKPTWLTKWRVRDLSAFGLADPAKWGASMAGSDKAKAEWMPRGVKVWGVRAETPRAAQALWSFIASAVFILWWIGVIRFTGVGDFALRGGDVSVTAAPIWSLLFGLILAWAVAGMAVDGVTLWRPEARRLQALLKIPVAAAGLWIGWRLFQAGHWATLTQGDQTARVMGTSPIHMDFDAIHAIPEAQRGLAETALTLGTVLSWVLAIIMLCLAVDILKALWRIATARD